MIFLFTLEGAMHGLLAIVAASIYGIPWIVFFAKKGISLPEVTDSYGFALSNRIFPFGSTVMAATCSENEPELSSV